MDFSEAVTAEPTGARPTMSTVTGMAPLSSPTTPTAFIRLPWSRLSPHALQQRFLRALAPAADSRRARLRPL